MIASIIFGNSYSHPKGWHLSCQVYVNNLEQSLQITTVSSSAEILSFTNAKENFGLTFKSYLLFFWVLGILITFSFSFGFLPVLIQFGQLVPFWNWSYLTLKKVLQFGQPISTYSLFCVIIFSLTLL